MIFPAITETLVLPLDAVEIEDRIREGIENKKFNGAVGHGRFSLSACLVRPPQFSPMVRGRIESSSRGSLIFIKYELFPATKLLLGIVSVIMIAISAGVAFEESAPLYFLGALVVVLSFRMVAQTNIRIHRTPVRQELFEILS